MNHKSIFTRDRSFYRSFFVLTITLMLQQAVVLSVNLADNIMLGNYSETALSGVAAVNQIQFVLQQLVFAISNGMIVLGSQYWGQKQMEPIKKLISIGIRCGVVVITALFLFVSIAPHFAVGLFTTDEAIITQGMDYLSIVRFTYLFFAITTIFLGGLQMVEKVKISLYVSIAALLINCSINYTLINGHFGFPEMGVKGAAIGTLTARITEFVIVSTYLFCKDRTIGFKIKNLLHIDRLLLKDYLRVSIPIIFTGLLWGCNTALQTVILGHMSSSAIAAHSISSTIFLFLKVTAVGAASSAAIIIGKTVGTGNLDKVKEYTRTLQVLFIIVGLITGSVLFSIREPLLGIYNVSAETAGLARTFMLIEATVLVFMSYQMSMNTGVIRGGGDTRYVMFLDIGVILCVVIPCSFLAAFVWKLPPAAVLVILNADQYLKCIPAAIYGNSFRWIKKLTRKDIIS